ENNVLDQTVVNADGIGEPVYDELKAGEASVHSDLTLHGSEANTSDRRRCGLTLRYTTTDMQAHLGWHEKGVIVAGEPVPHWANRERPLDDVKSSRTKTETIDTVVSHWDSRPADE